MFVAEVDRQCSGAEKPTLSISPDLEASADGRLARGTACASTRHGARRSAGPTGGAETSRDRSRTGGPPAHGAAPWPMEGTPDRRWGRIFTDRPTRHDLGGPLPSRTRKARREAGNTRQGCQRHVNRGARGRRHRARTSATRRSGSGVVNRRVPQSPPYGEQGRTEGRGESLGEMLGTHRARVLVVVEALGSTSRSNASKLVLRVPPQGGPQVGRASSSHTVSIR